MAETLGHHVTWLALLRLAAYTRWVLKITTCLL
jgi:hypothetical protein